MTITSFKPPHRVLMGPGPSEVHPRVLAALSRPTIGHLDPEFIRMMDETKTLLQYVFRTANDVTLPVSAPGSAGMETCFVNLMEPGDTVVVCRNGVFGSRMIENVMRYGGKVVVVDEEWGKPVNPERLRDALKANPGAKMVSMVHAETSTGVRSDVGTLCGIAREFDCLSVVDVVTSLAGIDVDVDGWGADAVYGGTQKCLSCPPGISPITLSPRAMEAIRARRSEIHSWFLDLKLITEYWGEGDARVYHHTAPVNSLYGLHEALLMVHEEGLEQSWERHRKNYELLRDGLAKLGIAMLVEEPWRLPMLNAVCIPEGVDDLAVRKRLLNEFSLEIGPGLGPLKGKIWRLGLLGNGSRQKNVNLCLSALRQVLQGDAASPAEPDKPQAVAPS